jgi:hypothetical protein
MRACLWLVLFSVCAACGGGEHMIDNYGQQSRRFFMKQRVNAIAAQGSPGGLDSEEAALIQASYKHELGKEQQQPEEKQSRVLLLKDSDSAAHSGQ